MNVMKHIILTSIMVLACIAAEAQTAVDSAGIYIEQSPGYNIELPENGTEFNEQPVLTQNAVRSISLYYKDQDEWITISGREDLQWGTTDLIGNSEVSPGRDSLVGDGDDTTTRLAELLGNLISSRGKVADGESQREDKSGSETTADDETMNAFREAFDAVMREENEVNGDAGEEDSVDLPVMYGNVAGIVLDETRSKTGRDFYNAFYEAWSKWKGVENSVVRVAEKPGPGMGSIVFVEVNYEEIFELRLRPGDQRTKQAGDVAAARTLSYLKENSNKILTY